MLKKRSSCRCADVAMATPSHTDQYAHLNGPIDREGLDATSAIKVFADNHATTETVKVCKAMDRKRTVNKRNPVARLGDDLSTQPARAKDTGAAIWDARSSPEAKDRKRDWEYSKVRWWPAAAEKESAPDARDIAKATQHSPANNVRFHPSMRATSKGCQLDTFGDSAKHERMVGQAAHVHANFAAMGLRYTNFGRFKQPKNNNSSVQAKLSFTTGESTTGGSSRLRHMQRIKEERFRQQLQRQREEEELLQMSVHQQREKTKPPEKKKHFAEFDGGGKRTFHSTDLTMAQVGDRCGPEGVVRPDGVRPA